MPERDKLTALQTLLEKGVKDKSEMARRLGVSRPTLYKLLNQLQAQGVNVIVPPVDRNDLDKSIKRAGKLIDRQVNILEQLNAINESAQAALKIAEDAAKNDKRLLGLVFKGCSEIREQLEFAAELVKMLYDAQAVQEFQAEVMEVIGSVDINVRREIESRLAERRAVRGAVSLPGPVGPIAGGGDGTGTD